MHTMTQYSYGLRVQLFPINYQLRNTQVAENNLARVSVLHASGGRTRCTTPETQTRSRVDSQLKRFREIDAIVRNYVSPINRD